MRKDQFIKHWIVSSGSSYWKPQNSPSNLTTEIITGGVRLTWVDNSIGEDGFEVWCSVDGEVYTLLTVTEAGVTTHDDIRAGGVTMDYKVRGFKGYSYSDFSNVEGDTNNIILACDATAGAAILTDLTGITGSPQCVIYFGDGTHAHMTMNDVEQHNQVVYSVTGTYYVNITNASSLKTFKSSQHYANVSCFNHCINIESITLAPGVSPYMAWTGSTNGWSTTIKGIAVYGGINTVTGDVGRFINLTSWDSYGGQSTFYGIMDQSGMTKIYIGGNNTITCNITGMNSLARVEKVGAGSTVIGSLNNKADFYFICVDAPCNISGDGTGNTMAIMEYLSIEGTLDNLGFDMSNCVNCWFYAIGGNSQMTGSIAGLTKLEVFSPGPSTLTKPVRFINNTKLSSFNGVGLGSTWIWTAAQVNQLLADIVTNKDVVRVNAPDNYRSINLLGGTGTEAPSGQGVIDKAYLQNYRSPNDDPAYSKWTITTR